MTIMLTKKEAADRLRCSVRSLDRLRLQGPIETVQVRGSVRITEAEIEDREVTEGGCHHDSSQPTHPRTV